MDFEVLRNIIAEVLDVDADDITMETNFVEDLGADSLDLFQIIMGVEEELDIEVDTEQLENITTVGAAYELITNTVGE